MRANRQQTKRVAPSDASKAGSVVVFCAAVVVLAAATSSGACGATPSRPKPLASASAAPSAFASASAVITALAHESAPGGLRRLTEDDEKELRRGCQPLLDTLSRRAADATGGRSVVGLARQILEHPPEIAGVDARQCAAFLLNDLNRAEAHLRESTIIDVLVGLSHALSESCGIDPCPGGPPIPPALESLRSEGRRLERKDWEAPGWKCVRYSFGGVSVHYQLEYKWIPANRQYELVARGYPFPGAPLEELSLRIDCGRAPDLRQLVRRRLLPAGAAVPTAGALRIAPAPQPVASGAVPANALGSLLPHPAAGRVHMIAEDIAGTTQIASARWSTTDQGGLEGTPLGDSCVGLGRELDASVKPYCLEPIAFQLSAAGASRRGWIALPHANPLEIDVQLYGFVGRPSSVVLWPVDHRQRWALAFDQLGSWQGDWKKAAIGDLDGDGKRDLIAVVSQSFYGASPEPGKPLVWLEVRLSRNQLAPPAGQLVLVKATNRCTFEDKIGNPAQSPEVLWRISVGNGQATIMAQGARGTHRWDVVLGQGQPRLRVDLGSNKDSCE